ncbi:hypothetical protein J0A68_07365 [Algoriphagus sp. H41]|uniref:O-Antigen ligase n=1 Tax=Algoriphagus oliviformis TaxID=2811231 RepID=A0ABS3C1G2_9BACT|nr:hypothetical protein [Algoriphagus oliviformis]MBN7810767.1 hypothetical protein [Algoriphagus oliviformis]
MNIFWISVILFSAGYTFSSSIYPIAALFQGLQVLGLVGLMFSIFQLASFNQMSVYIQLLLPIYVIWQLYFLLRGDFEGLKYEDVKSLIFSGNYGVICSFVPLALLLPSTLPNVKKMFDAIFILLFLYLVFSVVLLSDLLNPDSLDAFSREALETSVKFLAFPAGLILLTFDLHTNKRRLFALAVFAVSILLAIVRARRGVLLMDGIVGIFAFTFFFFNTSKKIGWVLAIVYLLILGYQFYMIEYSFAKINFLGNLFEKGLENTRTYVEECFYASMSTMDWIVGKGYNQGYQCPGIDESVFANGVRRVIETDYLQLILTGGLVNLFLILAMILPAVFLGFFQSSNLFCKKAATWIMIWIFFLYPSNGYTFSLFHISMWLMVGLCYSGKFRNLSDQAIINYFTKDIKINTSGKA